MILVSIQDYKFESENTLSEHPDPLTEGKKCLEAGDLPSAVLLFEAAAQKDSNNVEVRGKMAMVIVESSITRVYFLLVL